MITSEIWEEILRGRIKDRPTTLIDALLQRSSSVKTLAKLRKSEAQEAQERTRVGAVVKALYTEN